MSESNSMCSWHRKVRASQLANDSLHPKRLSSQKWRTFRSHGHTPTTPVSFIWDLQNRCVLRNLLRKLDEGVKLRGLANVGQRNRDITRRRFSALPSWVKL